MSAYYYISCTILTLLPPIYLSSYYYTSKSSRTSRHELRSKLRRELKHLRVELKRLRVGPTLTLLRGSGSLQERVEVVEEEGEAVADEERVRVGVMLRVEPIAWQSPPL